MEMDAQLLFFALNSSTAIHSPFGLLVDECKEMASTIGNVNFSWVR